MRRRSNTLYAETMEDYTVQAVKEVMFHGPMRRTNSKKKINASSLLPLLFTEDKSTIKREVTRMEIESECSPTVCSEKSQNFWSDFDFDSKQPSQGSEDSCLENAKSLNKLEEENTCPTDSTEDTEFSSPDVVRKSITRKFMVVGLNGCGRHSLINSIFESQGKEGQTSLRQTMDLIIKTRKEGGCETKYQFWMRALNDNRFDGLIKVYYRNASVFFFVYSVADRQSFEILDEAVQSILKEVPKEKFVGILLGNKIDQESKRKVDFSEGIALKEKHNLSLFLETHDNDQISKDRLFMFLNKTI